MELTKEEKQIVINLLSQVSVPVNQAQVILNIVSKLQIQLNTTDASTEERE